MDSRNFTINNGIMMGSERVVEMENVNLRKLLLDTLNSKPEFIGEDSREFDGVLSGKKVDVDAGDANLGKMLLDALRSKPEFLGQIDAVTSEETTYGQMAENSVRCALWLKKQGINSHDVVFTNCYNRLDSYIPILATFYNAAVLLFIYPGIRIDMICYFLNLTKPKFVFTEEEDLKVYEEAARRENLDVKIITFSRVSGYYYLNDILMESDMNEVNDFSAVAPLNPNDDCILPLTSGTTGDSKILSHSYKAIMEGLLIHTMRKEGEKPNDTSLIYLPLYWLISLRVMLSDVLSFTRRIVISETKYDLDEAFQLIDKYKVTQVRFSLSMMYRIFKWAKLETYDRSSLKTLTFNGVKLPPEIINGLIKVPKNGIVEQTYGATEMAIPMCRGIMNDIDVNSCGSLYPNMSMKIVDIKSGKTLGAKNSGEVCFKSPYLMKGYYKNSAATAKALDSEGWYHTGDLGYYDENELTFLHGRIDNNSVLADGKVTPIWQVERGLLLNSEVVEVCAVTHGNECSGTLKIVAFVVLLIGSLITESELSEIAKNCGHIKLPVVVKIIDSIPMTSNGKFKVGELLKQLD